MGFLANEDPAAIKYAEWTAKTCAETGVEFELRKVDKQDLEQKIDEANEDTAVNGIMVYYPVFGGKQVSHPLKMCGDIASAVTETSILICYTTSILGPILAKLRQHLQGRRGSHIQVHL